MDLDLKDLLIDALQDGDPDRRQSHAAIIDRVLREHETAEDDERQERAAARRGANRPWGT
jgi:hypothetical protein